MLEAQFIHDYSQWSSNDDLGWAPVTRVVARPDTSFIQRLHHLGSSKRLKLKAVISWAVHSGPGTQSATSLAALL